MQKPTILLHTLRLRLRGFTPPKQQRALAYTDYHVALLHFELACSVTHAHISKFNFTVLGSTRNCGIFLVWTAQNKYPAVRKSA
jgi:hypothetical protein